MSEDILVIKKYPNRRLYDPRQSRYITLADVREMVINEVPFKVVDRQSGEDITDSILLQIIMEREAGQEPIFTTRTLSEFIRNHGSTSQNTLAYFLEQSMELFSKQQKMAEEQMGKALGGVPMDSWLKLSEQNMKAWGKMQQDMFGMFPQGGNKKD